jgi:hypothetical protein
VHLAGEIGEHTRFDNKIRWHSLKGAWSRPRPEFALIGNLVKVSMWSNRTALAKSAIGGAGGLLEESETSRQCCREAPLNMTLLVEIQRKYFHTLEGRMESFGTKWNRYFPDLII